MSVLKVVPRGPGSVEWRVEAPSPLHGRSLAHCALGGVLLALLPAAWLGASWQAAAVAGAAAAGALALLHALLAVQWESLTYVRLLGVRLEARRRCGLGGSSLFLPLRMLQGLIIHEEVSATRADFFLALPLRPDSQPSRGSSPTPGNAAPGDGNANGGGNGRESSSLRRRRQLAGGSKRLEAEDVEVQVVFPRLRPRLSLLRQVYQQLSPLLTHDLEALRAGAAAQPGAEQLAAVPLPEQEPPSQQSLQIEEQRLRQR